VGDIGEMADVAERLRLVREARRKFLRMWAIDRSLVDPLVDRLAADLEDPAVSTPPHSKAPLADEG
jgi:hypothetical protein